MMNKHIGTSLNSFLEEEGLLEESELVATKRIIALQVEKAMLDQNLNKTTMADSMRTSRAALDRLLDPANPAVTLQTLYRAARAVGKKLRVSVA